MADEVKIPFGYIRVERPCRTAKGFAMWNGLKFERIKRHGRKWPIIFDGDAVIIRRAKVEQTEFDIAARIKVPEETPL